MTQTRVRLRACLAAVLAGSALLPLVALPALVSVPLVGLLAVLASWWVLPAEAVHPRQPRARRAAVHAGRSC